MDNQIVVEKTHKNNVTNNIQRKKLFKIIYYKANHFQIRSTQEGTL